MVKNMKKIIAILTAFTTAASAAVAVNANTDNSEEFLAQMSNLVSSTMSDDYIGSLNLTIGSDTMSLDGETIKIDNEGSAPIIENDTTLLPIRGVAEAVGAKVDYSAYAQTVSLSNDETDVNIKIGSRTIEINGEVKTMATAAKIENDRTLIPLRAATEALGCDVVWDGENKTITLTRPYQTKRVIVYSDEADTKNATEIVKGNDMTILQYQTEEQARASVIAHQANGIEAEPDYILKETSLSWGTDKINAPVYCSAYNTQHSDLTVAVIDSGMDSSNACFNNKIVKGYDIYNNDTSPEDITGHGTHVASTVADITSSFNKVKIMPVKVFGDKRTTSALIVSEGINYAVRNGAKVINLSLAGVGESTIEKKAVANALSKDVTVVAAAGNENLDLSNNYYSPACIPGVVTVASVDSNNKKAVSSSYGSGIIDFAAPGVRVAGAAIGGGTTIKSGTSMASPHISGAIALIRSINSKFSSKEAVNILKDSSENLGNSAYYGAGIPNLSKLVKEKPIASKIFVTTGDTTNIEYTNATVNGSVSYTGNRPSEVGVYFGTSAEDLKKAAKDSIGHNKNPFDMWYDLNKEAKQNLSAGTTYFYQCYAIQNGKEYTGEVKSFTTRANLSTAVKTTEAKYITDKNATVYGEVSYSSAKPNEVGIYFGTSKNNMKKIANDRNFTHNKNPFDIWYDLNKETNTVLLPNTTYYWQCYAITDGIETKGDIQSFKTQNTSTNGAYINTGAVDNITATNATVHGSAVYSNSRPSEVGLYFGTSENNMIKVAKDSINHNKNPFDIWYDLNSEANQYLSSDTTYYYKIYAIINGKEIYGETKVFNSK